MSERAASTYRACLLGSCALSLVLLGASSEESTLAWWGLGSGLAAVWQWFLARRTAARAGLADRGTRWRVSRLDTVAVGAGIGVALIVASAALRSSSLFWWGAGCSLVLALRWWQESRRGTAQDMGGSFGRGPLVYFSAAVFCSGSVVWYAALSDYDVTLRVALAVVFATLTVAFFAVGIRARRRSGSIRA